MISNRNFRIISAIINLVIMYVPSFLKNITWFVSECIPHTLKEETFSSGNIREIFGINFRELAVFAFLARINFREFMV